MGYQKIAIFRHPGETTVTMVAESHDSRHRTPDSRYFIIAPFAESLSTPATSVYADITRTWNGVDQLSSAEVAAVDTACLSNIPHHPVHTPETSFDDYQTAFIRCREQLSSGNLKKVVLARSSNLFLEEDSDHPSPFSLFAKACRLYPDSFIALFTTPTSGTWLIATPERLIGRNADGRYSTMALAGTILANNSSQWSSKEINEQKIVADYIISTLTKYTNDINVAPTQTVQAGSILHLMTAIDFSLRSPSDFKTLLADLHPTPAVCGYPKNEAFQFILSNEPTERLYYSGYCGLMTPEGDCGGMYVTLRCMYFSGLNNFILYAGGGILPESNLMDEWNETESKLLTLKRLFDD